MCNAYIVYIAIIISILSYSCETNRSLDIKRPNYFYIDHTFHTCHCRSNSSPNSNWKQQPRLYLLSEVLVFRYLFLLYAFYVQPYINALAIYDIICMYSIITQDRPCKEKELYSCNMRSLCFSLNQEHTLHYKCYWGN